MVARTSAADAGADTGLAASGRAEGSAAGRRVGCGDCGAAEARSTVVQTAATDKNQRAFIGSTIQARTLLRQSTGAADTQSFQVSLSVPPCLRGPVVVRTQLNPSLHPRAIRNRTGR